MAEFLPSSLPVWHLERKAPGDSPPCQLMRVIPAGCREARNSFYFLLNFIFFFFGNFSDGLNKFLIIDAYRCSLASILGLTWLQNHFADLHTLGLARLLAKGESLV